MSNPLAIMSVPELVAIRRLLLPDSHPVCARNSCFAATARPSPSARRSVYERAETDETLSPFDIELSCQISKLVLAATPNKNQGLPIISHSAQIMHLQGIAASGVTDKTAYLQLK
jgi:hypothetical protein